VGVGLVALILHFTVPNYSSNIFVFFFKKIVPFFFSS
jgi:hypothetical protein